jgi:hypothetical protein
LLVTSLAPTEGVVMGKLYLAELSDKPARIRQLGRTAGDGSGGPRCFWTSDHGAQRGLRLYLVVSVIEPSRKNKPAPRPLLSR